MSNGGMMPSWELRVSLLVGAYMGTGCCLGPTPFQAQGEDPLDWRAHPGIPELEGSLRSTQPTPLICVLEML